jgi:hypothetical protein
MIHEEDHRWSMRSAKKNSAPSKNGTLVPTRKPPTTRRRRLRKSVPVPDFDVALSFAGEDRKYVEKVAEVLRDMGLRVFYDKYEQVSLWGKDLYVHLSDVYKNRARYAVVFVSRHYARKLWTNHERAAAQARAFSDSKEYVLPARFDDTEIPGILPTVGHLDLRRLAPEALAEFIKTKVGRIERHAFMPRIPDRLYDALKAKTARKRDAIDTASSMFFDALSLMTSEERRVLAVAARKSCPVGPEHENNIHLNVHLLGRATSLSVPELLSMLARLDCLGITHRMTTHGRKEKDVVEIKYSPNAVKGEVVNSIASTVMHAMFSGLGLCDTCLLRAVEICDFSALSTLAAFPDEHDAA